VLDGSSIASAEQQAAREQYSGKLTMDFLEDRLAGRNFDTIRELDLSSGRIKDMEVLPGDKFCNLDIVDLRNNSLTGHGVQGLRDLPKLRVLRLGQNKVHSLLPAVEKCSRRPSAASSGSSDAGQVCFRRLEELDLS